MPLENMTGWVNFEKQKQEFGARLKLKIVEPRSSEFAFKSPTLKSTPSFC